MIDLDRLERVLIQAAREGRPVTYGQVLAFFGWKVTQVTVSALCRDLGRVAERRRGERWPDLACLVVRKSDGLPGEGYFTSLRAEQSLCRPEHRPGGRGLRPGATARGPALGRGPAGVTGRRELTTATGQVPGEHAGASLGGW